MADNLPAGPVNTDDMIESALEFQRVIEQDWPQVDEGELKHIIAGSLAYPLIAESDRVYALDEDAFPSVEFSETLNIPDESRDRFRDLTRSVGDYDFLRTPAYEHGDSPTKGGGGPKIEEVVPTPQNIDGAHPRLILSDDGSHPFMDPLGTGNRAIGVQIDDEIFYTCRPEDALAFKTLHFLQQYDPEPDGSYQTRKNEKMTTEFPLLIEAAEPIAGYDQLVKRAHEVVLEDELRSLTFQEGEAVENRRKYEKARREREQYDGDIEDFERDGWSVGTLKSALERHAGEPYQLEYPSKMARWTDKEELPNEISQFLASVLECNPSEYNTAAEASLIDLETQLPDEGDYSAQEAYAEAVRNIM